MFVLTKFPEKARKSFNEASIVWPMVVQFAIDGRVRNLDDLTNLAFYMHHRDRMSGGRGEPLDPAEPEFKELSAHWKALQKMIKPMLRGGGGSSSGSASASSGSSLAEDFVKFVKKVRRTGGSLSAVHRTELVAILAPLSVKDVKTLEWILVLWPKFGRSTKMRQMIGIVAGSIRKSSKKESARGRFGATKGGAIHKQLRKSAKATGANQCLNYLANEALDELHPSHRPQVAAAMKRYFKVGRDRKRKKQAHGGGTLSIMASELRLEGLVGPINILKWSAAKRRHDPNPVGLFDRLSTAGDGWYFFLCSAVSFHTFLVAVHVTGAGSTRRYFVLENGSADQKTRSELREAFDDFTNRKMASSRVWQIYRKPAD